jgi:dipeptide transport system permease protein
MADATSLPESGPALADAGDEPPLRGPWREFWDAYAQSRGALIGLALVATLIVQALFANVSAPQPPNRQNRQFTLTPTMWKAAGPSA